MSNKIKRRMCDVSELLGLTLTSIERVGDEKLIFRTSCNRLFEMYHCQDCCESVEIEDVCGDLQDLVGNTMLIAECATNDTECKDDYSCTWTFYKFATIKGHVTIRWYGTSNGFYSEAVDFEEVMEGVN